MPSSHVLRHILLKSRPLLDSWGRDLAASLAILDGHVVRMDGHFNLPGRIKIGGAKEDRRCMLAFLGCNGFLLKEVVLAKSEAGDTYLAELVNILVIRQANGLPPPHFIIDNPCLLEGKMGDLIQAVWGGAREYYLAGDPVHRKIELQESLDRTHQDAIDAVSDFSYVIRRFSNLLNPQGESGMQGAISKLAKHIGRLSGGEGRLGRDPFSLDQPDRARKGDTDRQRDAYLSMFCRGNVASERGGSFDMNHEDIIQSFAQSGRLKKALPSSLRALLVDYRDTPILSRSIFLPCGTVRRMLLVDDVKRHGRNRRSANRPEAEYFPAYDNYAELVQEVCRFAVWYSDVRRSHPVRRMKIPREGDDQIAPSHYPYQKKPVLGTKALDVLRRMLLRQNARHYLSHILNANDVYLKQAGSELGSPGGADAAYQRLGSSVAASEAGSSASTTGPSPECDAGGRNARKSYFAPGTSSGGFSIGSAAVEAFFEEI